MTSVEIGKKGEKYVVNFLKFQNYTIIEWDTSAPGSTEIQVEYNISGARKLVQVKTAVEPNSPADLSSDEKKNIKSRATKIEATAWQAKVQLDKKLKLKKDIEWSKL